MLDRVHHTSGSLLACTIVKLTLCPLLIAPGRPYQLSDSSLQSTMDASQIRNGPFNFWGQVGLKKICVDVRLYRRLVMATFVVYIEIISFYKIDRFIVVHLSTLNESNLKHRRSLSTTTDDQLPVLVVRLEIWRFRVESRASVEMLRFL